MALANPIEPDQLEPVPESVHEPVPDPVPQPDSVPITVPLPELVPAKDSVIVASHLTKKFGDEFAVQDISFEVPRASIFGFIGPSGSGKTTTVRCLTGVYTPTSGEVTVLNHAPSKFTQHDRTLIGYMPQLFVLYPDLTVWENMNFAASLYGMGLFRGKKLNDALKFVELYEHRSKLARNISGGMLRRLSLAATLVHNPQLLFLDEPTAGIDPVLRHKFWEHFRELKEQGRTIFITTQYVSEADNCDLVGVQNNGKLVLVDTPNGIRHRVYGGEMLNFHTVQPFDFASEVKLRALPFVMANTLRISTDHMRIVVDEASTATPELMSWAHQQNIRVKSIEEFTPSFEDVFVDLVRPEVNHG